MRRNKMTFDKDDIKLAVEANVEDFYGDPMVEPDEIPQMAVEDAFDAYAVSEQTRDELWDEMIEVAQAQYNWMHQEDHRPMP
jgi:hypothetical protein